MISMTWTFEFNVEVTRPSTSRKRLADRSVADAEFAAQRGNIDGVAEVVLQCKYFLFDNLIDLVFHTGLCNCRHICSSLFHYNYILSADES